MFTFGEGLSEAEQVWVAATINKWLQKSRQPKLGKSRQQQQQERRATLGAGRAGAAPPPMQTQGLEEEEGEGEGEEPGNATLEAGNEQLDRRALVAGAAFTPFRGLRGREANGGDMTG